MRIAQPIERYAIGYVLLGFVLLAVIGLLMQIETRAVAQESHLRGRDAAYQELQEAVERFLHTLDGVADRLALWDEARQQLNNPIYYAYWRDVRALSGAELPPFIIGVELYDESGRSLSALRQAGPSMGFPRMLPPLAADGAAPQVALREESGRACLYRIEPVLGPNDTPLGYVAVKADFLQGLRASVKTRYLDPASLGLALPVPPAYLNLADALEGMQFDTQALPEIAKLEENVVAGVLRYTLFGLAILGLAGLFLARQIALPLKRIVAHINDLEAGRRNPLDLTSLGGVLPVRELDAVARAINDYQSRLEALHGHMQRQHRQLEDMAYSDALTGAANRRGLELYWRELRSDARQADRPVAMVLFDCDHFKAINDTYGHDAGDEVLKDIVSAIQLVVRDANRPFRLGGDEFALILPDLDRPAVEAIAARCLEAVAERSLVHAVIGEPLKVSVGIAWETRLAGTQLETLKARADLAMYYAKRPASPKVVTYTDDMRHAGALLSSRIAHLVFEALRSGAHLEMHYQRIQAVGDDVHYHEALVRMRDPQNGDWIHPGELFPLVQAKALEVDFDLAIIDAIIRDVRQGAIPADTGLSINLSPPSLDDDRVMASLSRLCEASAGRHRLVAEVTESALIADLSRAAERVEQMHELGFLVALDDFGSGYCSLAYLTSMPVDIVKFDMSLIRSAHAKGDFSALVATLAKLLKDAGYLLVAEGVETERCFALAAQFGFDYVQGFLLDRPSKFEAKPQPGAASAGAGPRS